MSEWTHCTHLSASEFDIPMSLARLLKMYSSVSQPGFRRTRLEVPREVAKKICNYFDMPPKIIIKVHRSIARIFDRLLETLRAYVAYKGRTFTFTFIGNTGLISERC
jgi:hypothetical protein